MVRLGLDNSRFGIRFHALPKKPFPIEVDAVRANLVVTGESGKNIRNSRFNIGKDMLGSMVRIR